MRLTVTQYLQTIPNTRHLDLSYTSLCHVAFSDDDISLKHLEKLDMSGCVFVTDDCIKLLLDKLYCSGQDLMYEL